MDANRKRQFDDVFDLFSMLVGSNYVTLYDVKGQTTHYSTAIVDMVGLPGEYIEDGVYDWMDYIHPEDRDKYETTMSEMLALRQLTYDIEYRVRLKDGSYNRFRFVGGIIRDIDGHPSMAGGMMINSGLTENTDRVTVLPNLNRFFEDLSMVMSGEADSSILLVGFGRLEHINEIYGYGYGSQLLKEVSRRIRDCVKESGEIYRMDGSKFAILIRDLTSDEIQTLYDGIRHALKSGIEVDGVRHNLIAYGGVIYLGKDRSGAIPGMNRPATDNTGAALKPGITPKPGAIPNPGITSKPDAAPEPSARTIYDCLRHAYTESKRYRHGALVAYNAVHTDDPRLSGSIDMINLVRESMASDYEGFYLLYQPIFAKDGGVPIGAEALLRWRNERFGDVLPTQFLSEIEQDYAFEGLGRWIIRNALKDGAEFLEERPNFMVYINIAASQITDPYFADNVEEIAAEVGYPLSHLCLELTRECRMHDTETIQFFASSLREKGVRLGLDDFARGNAWLKTFTVIEPDYIRFAPGLVKNVADSERDQKIISYLSKMTDACGAEVFVKRVENEKIREVLDGLPIRGMQGSCFSEPVFYDEILDYF